MKRKQREMEDEGKGSGGKRNGREKKERKGDGKEEIKKGIKFKYLNTSHHC